MDAAFPLCIRLPFRVEIIRRRIWSNRSNMVQRGEKMIESLRYCHLCGESEVDFDLRRCFTCGQWTCEECGFDGFCDDCIDEEYAEELEVDDEE